MKTQVNRIPKRLVMCLFCILSIVFIQGCNKVESEELYRNSLSEKGSVLSDRVGENYYWYKNTKIPITRTESYEYLIFDQSNFTKVKSLLSNSITNTQPEKVALSPSIVSDNLKNAGLDVDSTAELLWMIVNAGSSEIKELNDAVLYRGSSYKNSQNNEMILSHIFYVKLKGNEDLSILEELAKSENVKIEGYNKYMPLWYTLSCTKDSKYNTLEMANLFYETGLFESCQPDFILPESSDLVEKKSGIPPIMPIVGMINDPYYGSQWHLKSNSAMNINFEDVYPNTQGDSSIIVAVVDHGIELYHPDLNVHTVSYDTETGTSPSRLYGDHGTICAGCISAKTNNGIGIASIASNCKVMSISNRLTSNNVDNIQKRADGINFAYLNGASVISCSWSADYQLEILDDAISNALSIGRGGKGCVVVFSAGNYIVDTAANMYAMSPSISIVNVNYPANSNPDILVVGAIDVTGARYNFGCYGAALDVVAPGVYISTTTTYGGYTSHVSGTSLACPIVAGVAALILSKNPNLTRSQVVKIIEQTARKVGNYTYSYQYSANRLNGTWNNEMGYGLVDAAAAVALAHRLR